MNKKKLFAVVISLALVIAVVLPGTLALSTDQASCNVTDAAPTETTTPAPDTTETPVPEGTEAPAETPTEEPVKTCTCDPKPAEGEAHKEGCPLYVKPVSNASKHIDTCSDDCTGEDCKCPCHLFDRLMACQTLEEIEAIIKATPEDVLKSLSEEQVAQVEAYMDKLMPAPLPAIVIEESEPPVESEIYRPTVNYTNVAPFGEPVTGGN